LLLRNTSWPFLGVTIIGFAVAIFVVLPLERKRQQREKAARERERLRESEFADKFIPSDSYNKLREKILERDGYKCRNCGSFAVEVYHIKPRSEGGSDTPENLITLCYHCHEAISASIT
jgi:predicted restriction endonuclease